MQNWKSEAFNNSSCPARKLKIMVCPHELSLSGSPINAVDLAAAIQRRGHVVEVYAPPGPLLKKIQSYSLPFVPAPALALATRPLTLDAFIAFAREVRRFQPDIVHTYESPPSILSAAVSAIIPHRNVITVMSMAVPDYIPEYKSLILGTQDLISRESWRRGRILLMEPPVDCELDSPADPSAARTSLGLSQEEFVVAVVGRLSSEHQKARGVTNAIQELVNSRLQRPLTLIIAGSGDEEERVVCAAERARTNSMLTVRIEGNVHDPRPIYDAADVVFGMGSSALRAMAHAKPLIVQGLDGFWELLTPESAEKFLAQGYFGQGSSGGPSLVELIMGLAENPLLRRQLGKFGRKLVLERYSMLHAVDMLESLYFQEATLPLTRVSSIRSAWVSLARYAKYRIAVTYPWIRSAYRSFREKSSCLE